MKNNLTKEQKLNICARAFYQDNEEDYETFRDAQVEFMAQPTSDTFVDFVVDNFVKPKEGHVIMAGPEGHVAAVRLSDLYFMPITEMTEFEGLEMEDKVYSILEQYPNIGPIESLEKLGWVKVIHG